MAMCRNLVTCISDRSSKKDPASSLIGIWVDADDRPITVTYELKATSHNGTLICSENSETHTFIPGHHFWGQVELDSLKEACTVTIALRVIGWEVEN